MIRRWISRMTARVISTILLLGFLVESSLLACPVCYGNKDSAEVEGARWAILFLLGITGIVLSGVVAFVVRLRRRSQVALDSAVDVPSSNEESLAL